jgi:hypothetical protein
MGCERVISKQEEKNKEDKHMRKLMIAGGTLAITGALAACIAVPAAAATKAGYKNLFIVADNPLATSAQAAKHKVRHPARQTAQPQPKPAGDPLYESCEFPWKHPDVSCPGNSGEGG